MATSTGKSQKSRPGLKRPSASNDSNGERGRGSGGSSSTLKRGFALDDSGDEADEEMEVEGQTMKVLYPDSGHGVARGRGRPRKCGGIDGGTINTSMVGISTAETSRAGSSTAETSMAETSTAGMSTAETSTAETSTGVDSTQRTRTRSNLSLPTLTSEKDGWQANLFCLDVFFFILFGCTPRINQTHRGNLL